ncbi:MAG: HAD family hydrolase [Xanthomonadales bacterium]|jgi:hypothetical protein|nr:HAD family hydrolase [Xanthomonadales bacterium]
MRAERHPLDEILGAVSQTVRAGSLPILVFDLDDTLFSTAPRDLRIIHEFAADHAAAYPEFARVAAHLSIHELGWSAVDSLVAAGLAKDDASIAPFTAYWKATFFTDAYAALDLPNRGAADFVHRCHAEGAMVVYLTGRCLSRRGLTPGMEQGTARALTTRGFPFWTGRCELVLKQDADQADVDFKREALAGIRALGGAVIATFDNEPANAHMFHAALPDAMNCWLKTSWDPADSASTEGLIILTDFRH